MAAGRPILFALTAVLAAGCTAHQGGAAGGRPDNPANRFALAWSPGGASPAFAAAAARLPGVRMVIPVAGGTVWLTSSRSAAGRAGLAPPTGMAIPLDLAAADPRQLAQLLPSADARLLPALARGQLLLGRASARLRGLGAGARLRVNGRWLRVAGVVGDRATGSHELLASTALGRRLGITTVRYLLMRPAGRARWPALARRLHRLARPLRVRGPGRSAFLREADSVLPPVEMKLRFGEFAADPQPLASGWMRIDPAWVRRHITTARVPILGRVTCNRRLLPPLRAALSRLTRRGLADLIRPGEYAGCYAPRFIPGSTSISHHAWGAALDINTATNAMGGRPHQDPRLVAAFQRAGFTWGGRWLVPDGMHFEYRR